MQKTEVVDERATLSPGKTLLGGALVAIMVLTGCSAGAGEESSTDSGSETIQSDERQDTDEAEALRSAGSSDEAGDPDDATADTDDENQDEDSDTTDSADESAARSGDGYVASFDSPGSQLFAYISGDVDLIGLVLADGVPVQITDVTVVNGVLYGISFDQLYLIDAETAEATVIGGLPGGQFNSLGTLADGALLAGSLDGSISIIDPETGSLDRLGLYPTDLVSSGDFVVMPDGTVLGSANDGENEYLVSVDPATGATEIVVDGLPQRLWGLMLSNDGGLLGFTAVPVERCTVGEIIEIDAASGGFTLTGCTGFVPGGAANSAGFEDRR